MTIHDSRVLNNAASGFPALDALLLFFSANIVLQPLTDADFGWHLRTGLDLLSNGLRMPETDPYSHTVPDWRWVDHAWLTDALIGLTYQVVGPLGVIALFAGVIAAAFTLAASDSRAGRTHALVAVACALWVARPFLGVRAQMVTLLGTAAVLILCRRYLMGRLAHLWVLPPLFVLWANLHGGFPVGLGLLGLFLATSMARRTAGRRWPALQSRWLDEPPLDGAQIAHVFSVMGMCAAATFVNPYGWRVYEEIYLTITDRLQMQTLTEWHPFSLGDPTGQRYVLYLAALGLGLLCCYRRLEPVRIAWLGVFFWYSLQAWRNLPLFLLISVPLWAELLAGVTGRMAAYLPGGVTFPKRWLLAVTIALAAFIWFLGPGHLKRVTLSGLAPVEFYQRTWYPIEAAQWIQTHRDQVGTRLYNDYGYGGFLLWWVPDLKIFIDGRMPAWRVGDRRIYADYLALTGKPPRLDVLDFYRIDWALVARGSRLDQALGVSDVWSAAYQDRKVTIYVKRPPSSDKPDASTS